MAANTRNQLTPGTSLQQLLNSLGSLLTAALLVSLACANVQADDPEKFMASIEKQGEAIRAMEPAEQLYQSCIYCHGKAGNAGSSFYPRLAGQPAQYLQQQLIAYRDETRKHTIMSSIARILSPAEIDLLVDYLSAQKPVAAAAGAPAAPAAIAAGQSRAAALACVSCHGTNYQGEGVNPRLAGQGREYLVLQLKGFRDGGRRDATGVMAALAAGLSDTDIENLSAYLSQL
ncbi:cytoChrome c, class I [gamma proteobacterium NOR5-3]|nr:cytoChrome c, class I [gamma proteobacterium NOR5-3]